MEIINKAGLITQLLLAKSLKKAKPIVVHINITNRCNLRCPYCYGLYWGKKGKVDFTTMEMISLFNELSKMGTRRINFGGGEPLLREDIGEIVSYARKKGMVCNMNSNGHLVPAKLSVVKQLNSLCISIDGDEAAHDKGKGKGSFKKVLEAIKIAKEAGVNVHTSTAITKENVASIDTIFKLSKKMHFVTEWLLPFFQTGENLIAEQDEYRAAIKKIISYKKKGYPILTSYKSLYHTLHWSDYNKKAVTGKMPKGFRGIYCYAGRFMCIINPDGFVYPCSQMVDTKFPALNFKKVGFKAAWENLEKNKDCNSCYAFMAFNDYNLLIERDLDTILNYIKNTLTEKTLLALH